MTKSICVFLLFVVAISFVTCTAKIKDFKNLKVIKTSLTGSLPSLLKRCQREDSNLDSNSTNELTSKNTSRLECANKNERIYIKKAEIFNEADECHKSLLPSLYVSQLCNNEIKCEISVDDDFLDICDDCSNKKILNLEYICINEDDESDKNNARTRSKRSFTEKYKDKVNRASRVLANNLGRLPLRFHYDAFYDPLYYEEDYFNDYYYYLDPRFRSLGMYYY